MPVAALRPRVRSISKVALPLLLVVLLGGCMLPPEPKTDAGRDVFNLYIAILVLAGIVFVAVEGFIVYAVIRYRRVEGDDALPPQLHGNNLVEIIWTVIPTVIVLVLFVLSVFTLGSVEARAERPGVTIAVEGFQWQWTFRYPDGGPNVTGTASEPAVMAVPVGEPVRLELASTDVIHAFYVPEFLIKRDVFPVGADGRRNEIEFTVTEAGTYTGQCAEFCGAAHADMTFIVEAMTRAEYDEWISAVAAGNTPPPRASQCEETLDLTLAEGAFEPEELEAPADAIFCVTFANEEAAGTPHALVIASGTTTAFEGEPVDGGEETTYIVPALPAGEYTLSSAEGDEELRATLTVGAEAQGE